LLSHVFIRAEKKPAAVVGENDGDMEPKKKKYRTKEE